ncbi:MAG TPA: adenylate/guanylate cyclase domain-containing protein [Candidatus Limnocylindrales bacterium]|nr:adenylate/guanylate cyclase domain-containing protein [Candidatus Limnocylindrales bacterium]
MESVTHRVTVDEIARRLGVPSELVDRLTETGVLELDADGRLDPGDVHRVRLLAGFDSAGVPLEALVAADRAGRISLRYYDELHPPPAPLSGRTYAEFAATLGDAAAHLPGLFAAFGLAEPAADTLLDVDAEDLARELIDIVEAIGQPDLALRAIRVFGDSARRATDGALATYAEAVARSDVDVAGLPIEEAYRSVLWPWSRFAQQSTRLAAWLAGRHLTRAIDAYSVNQTEEILEADGFVAPRPAIPPAIAFVDVTGFTKLTEERGDEAAAAVALRLGELASDAVRDHRGRLVKVLGDGVLLRFDDLGGAVAATLNLLAAMPKAGLPTGHAGIAAGYVIDRDNDVFGRTVNLAARIGDAAADGQLLLTHADAEALPGDAGYASEALEPVPLQGIGLVEVVAIRR